MVADVSNVKYYQKVFTEYSAIQDTAFVTTKPTDSSIKNLLAPFTAIIMAEEYCRKFHERYLIILDDLNAQASSFFSVQKQLKAFVPTTHWQDNTGVTRIYESPFESSCFLSTFFGKLFSRPNVEPGLITTIAIVETRDDRDKLPGYVTVENIAGQMMDQKIQLDHSVTQQENRKPAVVLKNVCYILHQKINDVDPDFPRISKLCELYKGFNFRLLSLSCSKLKYNTCKHISLLCR